MKKTILFITLFILSGLILGACSSMQPTLVVITRQHNPSSTATVAATPPVANNPGEGSTPTSTAALEPIATLEPTATLPPTPTAVPPTDTPLPTATETPLPALGLGSTRTSAADQMVEIFIPAGEFTMGSEGYNAKNNEVGRVYPEGPEHTVYLENYWIDKFEVSNQQYALCVAAGACQPPYLWDSETRESYYNDPNFSNYPVIWVSWYMANDYCSWAGRRLPTEAEWEKAARGTDGREFPWGNDPVDGTRANFCDVNCTRSYASGAFDDGYGDTSPVGSYPAGASPYGVMNMAGNVWEWVSTIIKPYPYDAADGREDPDTYAERVWRGGPWSNGSWWVRATVRYRSVPMYWNLNLGFRCASSE
jgi:serine/threonine-protein kinase